EVARPALAFQVGHHVGRALALLHVDLGVDAALPGIAGHLGVVGDVFLDRFRGISEAGIVPARRTIEAVAEVARESLPAGGRCRRIGYHATGDRIDGDAVAEGRAAAAAGAFVVGE